MQAIIQNVTNNDQLEGIKALYLKSFPPNERREFYEFKLLLQKSEFEVYLFILNHQIVGFASLWYLNDFVFIEHLAIDPIFRGQGIGSDAVKYFLSHINKTFLLEVEPPTDEVNVKRVEFYKRLGFRLIDMLYMQPSYDGVKPEVEMRLMLSADNYGDDWLNSCVRLIRSKVYGKT